MLPLPPGLLRMRQTLLPLVLAFLTFIPTTATHARRADCREVVHAFNNARSVIADTLQRYDNCVGDSTGSDDCSAEFKRLKNAQTAFAAAVSRYASGCD